MKLQYVCSNQTIDMEINQVEGAWSITLPDCTSHRITISSSGNADDSVSFDLEELDSPAPKRCIVPVAHTERGIEIFYLGQTYLFTEPSKSGGAAKRKRGGDTGSLTAPMVGVLSELFVAAGETVEAYQPLAIVEAMKVMATIEAPFAGTVKRVYVTKGAQLTHGQPIIDVEPEATK